MHMSSFLMALRFSMKSKSHLPTTPASPVLLPEAPLTPTSLYLSRETYDIYKLKYILFKRTTHTVLHFAFFPKQHNLEMILNQWMGNCHIIFTAV